MNKTAYEIFGISNRLSNLASEVEEKLKEVYENIDEVYIIKQKY